MVVSLLYTTIVRTNLAMRISTVAHLVGITTNLYISCIYPFCFDYIIRLTTSCLIKDIVTAQISVMIIITICITLINVLITITSISIRLSGLVRRW